MMSKQVLPGEHICINEKLEDNHEKDRAPAWPHGHNNTTIEASVVPEEALQHPRHDCRKTNENILNDVCPNGAEVETYVTSCQEEGPNSRKLQ